MSHNPHAPTILQVIPDLETGGAERTTVDVAEAIRDRGWNAIVASAGGRMVPELSAAGADHVTLPLASKNPLVMWRNAGRLAALCKERSVSIVHARSRAPAWSALAAAKKTGLPFVTTYHGIYNQRSALKAFYNSVMARGDTVIANSGYTAKLIANRHPMASGKITVIHRGSDMENLAPSAANSARGAKLRQLWALPEDRPVILQLARLTAWKGQKIIIEAMARLKTTTPVAPIAVLAGDAQGRTGYLENLKALIAENGLEEDVRLVGHCDDIAGALAVADLSVVASIEAEAFGRAAVEAQAAGVPVIVSDLGAVPETVLAPPEVDDANRTGWRVPPGDSGALADSIEAVLSAPDTKLAALTERALSHVREKFTVEAMCSATLDVYSRHLD